MPVEVLNCQNRRPKSSHFCDLEAQIKQILWLKTSLKCLEWTLWRCSDGYWSDSASILMLVEVLSCRNRRPKSTAEIILFFWFWSQNQANPVVKNKPEVSGMKYLTLYRWILELLSQYLDAFGSFKLSKSTYFEFQMNQTFQYLMTYLDTSDLFFTIGYWLNHSNIHHYNIR